jgi:hypothetical protein
MGGWVGSQVREWVRWVFMGVWVGSQVREWVRWVHECVGGFTGRVHGWVWWGSQVWVGKVGFTGTWVGEGAFTSGWVW